MHDAQIRVAIAGAGGQMGRQLIQAALQMEGVALGAGAGARRVKPGGAATPASWRAPAKRASRCRAAWRR